MGCSGETFTKDPNVADERDKSDEEEELGIIGRIEDSAAGGEFESSSDSAGDS